MGDDGVVTGFVKRGGTARRAHHFIGVQVVHAAVFRQLPDGEALSSVGGVYDALIASRPGSVRGVLSDASFWDIGTPDDYARTSAAFEMREAQEGARRRPS
jgi:hypothetical protein